MSNPFEKIETDQRPPKRTGHGVSERLSNPYPRSETHAARPMISRLPITATEARNTAMLRFCSVCRARSRGGNNGTSGESDSTSNMNATANPSEKGLTSARSCAVNTRCN